MCEFPYRPRLLTCSISLVLHTNGNAYIGSDEEKYFALSSGVMVLRSGIGTLRSGTLGVQDSSSLISAFLFVQKASLEIGFGWLRAKVRQLAR